MSEGVKQTIKYFGRSVIRSFIDSKFFLVFLVQNYQRQLLASSFHFCNLQRDCGQWLSLLPSTVSSMELSAQKFRKALLLRCARGPPNLPPFCDGCDQKHCARHALECKKGGLVISRHNEIREELSDAASKAQFATNPKSMPVAARK
jgi:hypothetical protein